jgi:putative ABC transport system ATP-binding protein
MPTIVRLERVGKDYTEGGKTRVVLKDASAELAAGEMVAVQGRSGSGKSTLLNLVAGLDRASAGEVFVDGIALGPLSPTARTVFRRDHLGLVFQFFNLIPTLTALENVRLPAELAGRDGRAAEARARELLAEVGLADRALDFPDRLSGGEQQRVAVARALVASPKLVLADEPTGNLDDATGRSVLDLLERLSRGAGRTLVVATHSPQVAARADRVLAIENGRIEERP